MDETVATAVQTAPLACIECGRPWLVAAERWRVKLLVDHRATEAVPYCPDCHRREFECD
jgi:hypothetical protein